MRIMKYLGHTTLAATIALATASFSAQAAYPEQPIKILIPFTPGGGTDFESRMVGTKSSELTGWEIVIENRPGAGGNLAVEAASKAHAVG